MEQIKIGANTSAMLQYLDSLDKTDRFDSRILFRFVRHETQHTHKDWIEFIQVHKKNLTHFAPLDIRTSPSGEEFTMLSTDQGCIVLLFNCTLASTPFSDLLAYLHSFRKSHPFAVHDGFTRLFVGIDVNKTMEEAYKRKETPLKKEKRLERDFGEKLTAQGISVQYQVRCEYGIADIVTPEAIYEIKASLTRSNLHKAASQVLLYRNCINPSAKAVVVGYPYKKHPIDFEMVKALGVEVIVCEDTEA